MPFRIPSDADLFKQVGDNPTLEELEVYMSKLFNEWNLASSVKSTLYPRQRQKRKKKKSVDEGKELG